CGHGSHHRLSDSHLRSLHKGICDNGRITAGRSEADDIVSAHQARNRHHGWNALVGGRAWVVALRAEFLECDVVRTARSGAHVAARDPGDYFDCAGTANCFIEFLSQYTRTGTSLRWKVVPCLRIS